MPFSSPIPRPFTSQTVRLTAPQEPGVYGISNATEWLYIGETSNIQGSLLGHLQQKGLDLRGQAPTGFVFEVCRLEDRMSRQDRLVLEYEPVCNRREATWDASPAFNPRRRS